MTTPTDALPQLNRIYSFCESAKRSIMAMLRDYTRFLDHAATLITPLRLSRRYAYHAADLIFLQKVGGGYRFIHRLLLEHFAAMVGEGFEG